MSGHVVVVGDDGLGVRVLEELLEHDLPVAAVCAEPDAPLARAARAMEVPLVVGDPEDEGTLREAGVEDARAWGLFTSVDIANLHAALELQELAPGAKVVLRLANTQLTGPARELVGDVPVLSATELAAPAFLEAALAGSEDLTLRVADRQVSLQEVDADDPRLMTALAEAEGDDPQLFPAPAGRVVGLVDHGRLEPAAARQPRGELEARLVARREGLIATARRASRTWWLLVRGTAGVVDRRLAVVGALLVLLITVGSAVIGTGLGISPLDAFYFVVVTVATVGYGDINLLDAAPSLKVFGVGMIMLGGLTLALLFGLVTDAIVGARLARSLGQLPIPRRDHVVVCGVGTIGGRVIRDLVEAGVPAVAVERDEDRVDLTLLKKLGVPVVVGDAAAQQTLESLRLGSARALMALTNDDAANLQCALLARSRASSLRIVVRLFNPRLAARVERAAGIHLSRSVSGLAAPAFVAALLGRRVSAVLPVGPHVLQLATVVAERAAEVGRLEQGLQARVVAAGGVAFPARDLAVAPGTELTLVGTGRALTEVERRLGVAASQVGRSGDTLPAEGERRDAGTVGAVSDGETSMASASGAGGGGGPVDTRAVERDPDAVGTNVDTEEAHKRGIVFWTTLGIALAFVLVGVFFTESFNSALTSVVGEIKDDLGWLYLLAATFFLFFVLYIAFSRYGKLTLGAPGDKPEFGLFSWFAMLFQAGMGIGILFWGVGEPILHFNHPPLGQAQERTPEAANLALQYAFYHWGLHPWAMYATVGLAVGYFSYRRGLNNLLISQVFRPVFGDRVDGGLGKAIDILAIMATLFGVAVSLGAGTLQIDAGLNSAFGLPSGTGTQLLIIGVTAIAYMLSASTPVERGVQTLSNLSMALAFVLLIFFFFVGSPLLAVNAFTQGLGFYAINLVPMSLRTNAFNPDPWLGDWTIFFWATWIAWAPYVGAFIARISRGRTIREFVVGTLVAPSLFTFIWFAVFGAVGIQQDRVGQGALGEAVSDNAAVAFFEFIDLFPLAFLVAPLVIFLVWIFFVAGADAGTVVLGSMSTGGVLNPTRTTKLTWGVVMGAIAAILLVAGGLDALQNGAILAATPFAVLMLIMAYALIKALREDAAAGLHPELEAPVPGVARQPRAVPATGQPRLAGGAPEDGIAGS